MELKLTTRYQKLWEQCWDPQVCGHIPFDGTKCIGAHICVRLIEDGGHFFIEGEIEGHTARYELGNACIPALTIGVAKLEVCASNVKIENGILKSLTLVVKACLGADIGPIHLEKCWDLLNQVIVIHTFSMEDIALISGARVTRGSDALKFVGRETSSLSAANCHCS